MLWFLNLNVCQPWSKYKALYGIKTARNPVEAFFFTIAFEMHPPSVYIRMVKELFSKLKQNKQIYHFSYLNLYALIRMS